MLVVVLKELGEGAIHPSERSSGCPPPCSQRARCGERNVPLGPLTASCSPVGDRGRLVPSALLVVSAGETAEAPTPMHVHNRASTPSLGGREGIKGSGVSRHPEGKWIIPSFLSYCRKGNYTPKPSTARAGKFIAFSSGRTMLWQHRLPPADVFEDPWV